jgi:hypothetical protein
MKPPVLLGLALALAATSASAAPALQLSVRKFVNEGPVTKLETSTGIPVVFSKDTEKSPLASKSAVQLSETEAAQIDGLLVDPESSSRYLVGMTGGQYENGVWKHFKLAATDGTEKYASVRTSGETVIIGNWKPGSVIPVKLSKVTEVPGREGVIPDTVVKAQDLSLPAPENSKIVSAMSFTSIEHKSERGPFAWLVGPKETEITTTFVLCARIVEAE